MKVPVMLAVVLTFLGCGTDKTTMTDTKLDAPLRERMAELQDKQTPEVIDILGKCVATIDGHMRQSLLDVGAEVVSMTNDIFTARVSSLAILDVAALEFVTQLQLLQVPKGLSR